MSLIHIKKADNYDAPIISYLGKKTFKETFGDLFSDDELNTYLNETFDIEKLEKSILKVENVFGILYYLGNPAGYYKVKMGMHFDHSADVHYIQLQKIYVLRDYLHLKLGENMLKDIFYLKEIEECKIMWLVVLNTNCRAIKFYSNHGFEKLKKYHYQIGTHCLEYELMIKPFPV